MLTKILSTINLLFVKFAIKFLFEINLKKEITF